MSPGTLVRIRPHNWTVRLRVLDASDDDLQLVAGETIRPDDILTVVEAAHLDLVGLVKVLTPRGSIGYLAAVRLEAVP